MITFFVVAAIVFTLLALLVGNLVSLDGELGSFLMAVSCLVALLIGAAVAFWIGGKVQYVQTTPTIQPLVSIYTNQSGNEIYLKAVSGSALIYRIMENDVPREKTIGTNSVTKVVTEDVKPYMETSKYLFKQNWYEWFVFSPKNDIVIFHVPQAGIETDINALLK